jgi:hypothetical protein
MKDEVSWPNHSILFVVLFDEEVYHQTQQEMKFIPTKPLLAFLLAFSCLFSASAQNATPEEGTRAIEFPDIPGYVTLKCDLHMHTVFSDGSVWPDIRVQEAIRDGLDVIAITDHVEYQPKKKDIPHENRNRGYELALKSAGKADFWCSMPQKLPGPCLRGISMPSSSKM